MNIAKDRIMINLDSFYTIGKSHQVCQDYVIHSEEPVPCVILGDGCSSSPDTDVGARLLVQTAKNLIIREKGYLIDPPTLIEFIKNSLVRLKLELNINHSVFDSTLMLIYRYSKIDFNNEGIYRLMLIGDGIIISKPRMQLSPSINKISFLNEMPYYLSYKIDGDRDIQYFEKSRQLRNDCRTKITENAQGRQELFFWDLIYKEYPIDVYEYIIICSDGLNSFYHQETGEKIPLEDVVKELTNFKSTKGEFLKRRMKRLLKEYEKRGIHHYDDLSVGIIYNEGGN